MASTPVSPVGQTAPAQPQSRQRGSPKQFVGLSKNLNTKEKSFRYLDFAEGGTNAALNKWGQFLQFSRLVVGGGDPSSWEYVSVEPRNISRIEHIPPAETSLEPEQGEGEDSYSHYSPYIRRHDKFDALCLENQGLGLRFSGDTKISELEHYYRNDRWPEVRYTVEGKVKVVLQHYIRDGEIIQDMCLTSESGEETQLGLEFEFTTGIRLSIGEVDDREGGEEDAPDHFLEPVSEGETPGSHWKIRRPNYYATASLFEDGKPKPLALLRDGEQNKKTKCDILSDDPVRHCETFILKSGASVKFTSVFKLDHENIPSTPPQYLDISPHLELFVGRWWSFKTESSSFIFRRNLETILSQAMPLPRDGDESYQPYVLHDHDLTNTYQTWSTSLDQVFYLLEIHKVLQLQQQNTADDVTKSYYNARIREVIFGYFVWILRYAERNGFPETVILHWSGKLAIPMKKDETGELVSETKGEKEEEVQNGPAGGSFKSEVAEPAELVGASIRKIDSAGSGVDSLLSTEAPGTVITSQTGKPKESVDRPSPSPFEPIPRSPFEPELSKYEDKFQNCCRFLVLLDMCLAGYPDEEALITRVVKAFLKLAWEPIEMSKHGESNLWPDGVESPTEFPPPYARFLPSVKFLTWENYKNCGYGGQDIYVYDIATQVLVWRAVKSTKRLLRLVPKNQDWSKWMDHQKCFDNEAIRDRTMEAFPLLGTDASRNPSPGRFVSKIKGHVREPFLEKWACDIAIPSFVEDFFDDKNDPGFSWTETLRYYDKFMDSIKSQTPNTWEAFMRYQLAIGGTRRQKLRKSLEERAYSVGLFAGGTVAPSSHCPYATSWVVVRYVLIADHTEFLYPQFRSPGTIGPPIRIDVAQGPTLRQEDLMSASTNPGANISASVRQEGRKSRMRGKALDITAEDRRQVNDPPLYGEGYLFRDPVFMKHKPKKFEMSREFVESFLGLGDSDNWCCFWETDKRKDKYLENLEDVRNYDWGNVRNTWIKPYRNRDPESLHGNEALLKLWEPRDRCADRKRIIVMKDCMIDHLIALMATLDFQEASHISEFLSRMRPMDSHEMRFEELAFMPDNLWITEFNINFIITVDPAGVDVESPLPPNYFPRRREKFLSMNDVVPNRIMAEAAIGFRIIGDLHDRYWTCYVFYDFGRDGFSSDASSKADQSGYGKYLSQRKCLEGFLVCQALDLVLLETKTILDTITKCMGGENGDGLSREDYFKTMNKYSTFYPWLLEVYIALKDKCSESRSVANSWIQQGENRTHKPRWSEKDQKSFGEEVTKNRAGVKVRCARLDKMAKNLEGRIQRISALKESLSSERSLRVSELSLRQAITSAQTADTMSLFAIVTIIYLPLTFSSSIVAIQNFNWPSPAKALVRITLAVTFGTLILLMNLAFLRRNLTALKTWAQHSLRRGMDGPSGPGGSGGGPISQEKRPAWKFWKARSRGLYEEEKRNTLLTDNATHGNGSAWWYWYFMAIFIIIVVPVQELNFIFRTIRLQKIKRAGPLKKLVRVPWAPIWIMQLALVYVIMLVGYAFLFIMGLMHRTVVWLWTGDDIAEGKEAAKEEAEASLIPKPDSAQEDRGLLGWLEKPAKTMQLLIVAEALHPKKEREFDVEKSGATVETTEVSPPS